MWANLNEISSGHRKYYRRTEISLSYFTVLQSTLYNSSNHSSIRSWSPVLLFIQSFFPPINSISENLHAVSKCSRFSHYVAIKKEKDPIISPNIRLKIAITKNEVARKEGETNVPTIKSPSSKIQLIATLKVAKYFYSEQFPVWISSYLLRINGGITGLDTL